MNHGLSLRLARIVNDAKSDVASTSELSAWLDENAIGRVENRRIHLTAGDRDRIARLLGARGVDLDRLLAMPPLASRADAFRTALSEKDGAAPVGRGRSLVRALPGRTLKLADELPLPAGASLDVANHTIASTCRHASILLVENRECFDNMEMATFAHPALAGDPLVLFRGSPGVSAGSSSLIACIDLPVDVFGDVDPEGLAIAGRTRGARSFVHPTMELMEAVVAHNPNHQRFRDQMVGAAGARDSHPAWLNDLWEFLLRHGCALPQEAFMA